ncbi:hypothetical protein VYU27_001865 [Nannochloropsis oceanica]
MIEVDVTMPEGSSGSGSAARIIFARRCCKSEFPIAAHSGAARAGVENLTKSMALEWVGKGVRVNCVAPGIVSTESGFVNNAHWCGTAKKVSSSSRTRLFTLPAKLIGVDGGMGQSKVPLRPQDHEAALWPIYGELPAKAKL